MNERNKSSEDYLKELLRFTQDHTDITLRIQTLYPPSFYLVCGERADFCAYQKGFAIFLKAVDAIHDQAEHLATLDYISKPLAVEIELEFGEFIPEETEGESD